MSGGDLLDVLMAERWESLRRWRATIDAAPPLWALWRWRQWGRDCEECRRECDALASACREVYRVLYR